MTLKIRCLGAFEVARDSLPIAETGWGREKTKALFKVLLSKPGRIFTQDQLIEYLWPGVSPQQAASNLRGRIGELRRALEPGLPKGTQSRYILTHRQGYSFSTGTDCWLDTEEFTHLCEEGNRLEQQAQWAKALHTYEQAESLYRGDFLEEDRYEEWTLDLREGWREAHLALLERLAECHARVGQYSRALARCHQIQRLQKHRENVYRQLMLYYYLAGDHQEALKVYQQCRQVLEEELQAKPSSETETLYQQIRERSIPGIDQEHQALKIAGLRTVRYSLGRTPFVGREADCALLLRCFEEAQQQKGQLVLISGEAGVGKTRLVQETLAYVQQHNMALVLQGCCQELTNSLAFQPLIEGIREVVPRLDPRIFKALAPLWVAEVANLVPELRERFPTLPINPVLPPEQARNRQFEGLTRFLTSLIPPDRALAFFLDDLHWSDSSTVEFLSYLLRRLEGQKLLVVGTYRADEVEEKHPLRQLRREASRRDLLKEICLHCLSRDTVNKLLEQIALGLGRNPVFRHRLYQETDGNPFFLVAILQALLEEGAIRITAEGRWEAELGEIATNYRALMAPQRIREAILGRVERLGEPEQGLLHLASVMGREVDPVLLERAWENENYQGALERATHAQLLTECQGCYTFSHDKIREIIYEELAPSRRQSLHGRVLSAMEQLYLSRLEDWAGLLAQHAYRAGLWKQTLEYALQAVHKAVKEFQYQEGLELAALGLEAAQRFEGSEQDRGWIIAKQFELLSQRTKIHTAQGHPKEHEQDLQQMEKLAKHLGEKGRLAFVFTKQSDFYTVVGRQGEAEEMAHKALDLYREMGAAAGEATALRSMGRACWIAGRYEEALEHYHQALTIFERLGDQGQQGSCLYNIGTLLEGLGRWEEALDYCQQALAIRRATGDRRGEALNLVYLGLLDGNLGWYEDGLNHCRQGLEICQTIGDQQCQGLGMSILSHLYTELGKYEEALGYCMQAVKLYEQVEYQRGQGLCIRHSANIYLCLGRYEDALQQGHHALEIFRAIGDCEGQGQTLFLLGRIYQEMDNPIEALNYYGRGRAIYQKIGQKQRQVESLSEEAITRFKLGESTQALACSAQAVEMLENGQAVKNPQEIYLNHYKILAAEGQTAQACTYLQRAYDEVTKRAAALLTDDLRGNFLENVKTNREIIQAYQTKVPH